MTRLCVLMFTMVLGFSSVASANVTVKQWLEWSSETRSAYVFGVYDSWVGFIYVSEKTIPHEDPKSMGYFRAAVACVEKMKAGEFATVVEKYIREHPQYSGDNMAGHVFAATSDRCTR